MAASQGLAAHELPAATRLSLARQAMAQTWPGFAVTEGSDRPRTPLVVVDYDPAWPQAYERWRQRIAAALGRTALRIEYVGSTSVPGLAAKPVVDIQVSAADLGGEPRYVPPLQAIGLVLRSRDELHRFLRPSAGQPREVHVHVCPAGGQWERDHLLFRDYLRAHRAACPLYAEAKGPAPAAGATMAGPTPRPRPGSSSTSWNRPRSGRRPPTGRHHEQPSRCALRNVSQVGWNKSSYLLIE